MEEHVIVDSSFSAVVNAPLERQSISQSGASVCRMMSIKVVRRRTSQQAPQRHGKGRRMSINVEVIGGTLMVQHYVEVVSEKHHLVLESVSDLFTTAGRTKILVMWELSVRTH